ncbi:MAG: porin family protein [Deltaproteobacteria bacterium]|nr:porin family protein [Deltaproteobacteria bacterium]
MKNFIKIFVISIIFWGSNINAQEFLSPLGQQNQVGVKNDKGKYFELKPGNELSFKITGPNTIKVYGRIINPTKAGNASFMIYQGNTLIGAMLVTPKVSQDVTTNNNIPVSTTSIQEFNISDGEQIIKIKSSPKSPETIIAVELMKSLDSSIELIPLVPLAPLVPPKEEEKQAQIDLVPLVPLIPPDQPKVADKKEDTPKKTDLDKKEGEYREIIAQSTAQTTPKDAKTTITTVVETTEKPRIAKRVIRLSTNAGVIIPIQDIGGPFGNFNIEALYFPIKNNYSFGIGLNVGYHNLKIDVKDNTGKRLYEMGSSIIPINLMSTYSIPITKVLILDLFAMGGISIVSADLASKINTPSKSASSTTPSFGGGFSLEMKLTNSHGIALICGFEGGRTSLDFVRDLEIGGFFINMGYNYTF